MLRIDNEEKDDELLGEAMRVEERLDSIDYDVWTLSLLLAPIDTALSEVVQQAQQMPPV